jgi:hypothetical protein
MLRWEAVEDKILFDMTVKMYREPFHPLKTVKSAYKNLELDHYAYRHLGSELYMYRILDTNFEKYIEERGDLSRMGDVLTPTQEDTLTTVL